MGKTALSSRLLISALVLVTSSGCRRGENKPPEDAHVVVADPRARTFWPGQQLVYVYADFSGRFETAAARADVPRRSRKVVRVIEPTVAQAPPGDHEQVWVSDLRGEPGADGLAAALMSPVEFESRALAALPPGQASRIAVPGAPTAVDDTPHEVHDQIILYGTSWCAACRQARTYLTQREIEFVEYGVEKDLRAAAELHQKARGAGIVADRVPIIDVRGRLMVGFDSSRLTTLLGEPI